LTFTDTDLPGVVIIEADVFPDARGSFVRAWVATECGARGLDTAIAQCSFSNNHERGTIRGMHFQTAPFDGSKTVRVTRGAAFDVAIDLRPDSPTFRRWFGVELTDRNHRALYLPPGCAHGYQTLAEDVQVLYFQSAQYAPNHQAGVRWNDPAFGVRWPIDPPTQINDRDRTYPDFPPARP
jgi:dTDP-4-dehydrorhamnose 3,5-epimerase